MSWLDNLKPEALLSSLFAGMSVKPEQIVAMITEWDNRFRGLTNEVDGFKSGFRATVI